MMSLLDIQQSSEQLMVSGELSLHTIDKAFEKKSLKLLASPKVTVNLSQVTKVDSAGLAWMLLLVERSDKQKLPISFVNLPQELQKLAKLSGVATFLSNQ